MRLPALCVTTSRVAGLLARCLLNGASLEFLKFADSRWRVKGQMKTPVLLLIDDQEMVAEATKLVLTRAGVDVLVANSPLAALATWNSRKSDIALVISDFELDTHVNGEQLIERFRIDKPTLKSILFSGYPLDREGEGRTEGVDFFQKPFNSRELVGAVSRLLQS